MFMEVYLRNTLEDTCLRRIMELQEDLWNSKILTCSTRLYLEGKGPHGSRGRQRNRLGEEIKEDTACADRRNRLSC